MKKTMLVAMCLVLAACSGQTLEQVVKKVQDKQIKDGDAIVVTGMVGKFGAKRGFGGLERGHASDFGLSQHTPPSQWQRDVGHVAQLRGEIAACKTAAKEKSLTNGQAFAHAYNRYYRL